MAKARKRRKSRRKSTSRRRTTRKRRSRRKTTRKRRKVKSKKKRKKSMAKRGFTSKLNSPIIRKVLMASGLATIAVSVASLVLPNQAQLINSPVVRAGLGFVVGDIPGALTNFLLAGGIGGLTGGGNGGSNGGNTGGFA